MNPGEVEDAAQVLVETRRTGRLIKALPVSLVPPDLASGYRVQDAFIKTWGKPLAGWKIGATAKASQDRFGIAEPFAGPFFAPDVMASPARPPAAQFAHRIIECEFAFRIQQDVAAQAREWTRAQAMDLVDAVIPAFEIVGTRFDSMLAGQAPTAIADCSVNAGMVLGKPVADWREFDYASHPVRLVIDGKVRVEGSGAAVLGDPLVSLAWAMTHLGRRGIGLKAGAIISTGTATGLTRLEPGEVAVADFGAIGTIEMAFTGAKHPTLIQGL